jgi:hypothetical protein
MVPCLFQILVTRTLETAFNCLIFQDVIYLLVGFGSRKKGRCAPSLPIAASRLLIHPPKIKINYFMFGSRMQGVPETNASWLYIFPLDHRGFEIAHSPVSLHVSIFLLSRGQLISVVL